jgi:HEAT repeat protein
MKTLKTLLMFASLLAMFCTTAYGDKRLPTHEEVLEGAGIAVTPDALIAALRNEDGNVRQSAAATLGERRVFAAIPALAEVLTDEYVYARIAAAGALLRLDDTTGVAVLDRLIADGDAHTAVAAAQAFAAVNDSRGLDPLIARLAATKEAMDRMVVVRAIAGFRRFAELEPKIRTALLGALRKDDNSNVRMAATEELSEMSGAEVQAALAEAAQRDADPGVRAVARAALEHTAATRH